MGLNNDQDSTFISHPKPSKPIYEETSNRYQKVARIGHGSFGEVFKAWDKKTSEFVALKRMKTEATPDGEVPLWAFREADILQVVDHENIVNLVEICLLPGFMGTPDCYIALEYCSYDLSGLIHSNDINFQIGHIRDIMQQMFCGLVYLHDVKGIMHRDLKPANILVNKKGIVKITDFGMSRLLEKTKDENCYTSQVCTLWFRAPELLLGSDNYGPEVDMWSAGLIMSYLLAREPLLKSGTEQGMLTNISKLLGSITPEVWPGVEELPLYKVIRLPQEEERKVDDVLGLGIQEPSALELINNLLVLDPRKRATAQDSLISNFISKSSIKRELGALLAKCHEDIFDYFRPRRAKRRLEDALRDQEMENASY